MQEIETEEQKKDRERLDRYIVREQLVCVMNNTKWAKLRDLMVGLRDASPRYRIMCLRVDDERGCYWDGDWYYHLPLFKSIEWLDIDPIVRRSISPLREDKKDITQILVDLLRNNHIPFSMGKEYIRIWGYNRPGNAIEFA
jgi:hypothetical protein